MAKKPSDKEAGETATQNGEPEAPAEQPYKPGTGQFSEETCNDLRRLFGRKLRVKAKIADLTSTRKSLEAKIAQTDDGSKANREAHADWSIVDHKLTQARADLSDLSGKMDEAIREADQQQFEFAKEKAGE